ncbi:MAG: VCBS repeat-containing protein [Planctomycetota bacterium]|nr:MAG: VCBS repeat-containing protein [Planctomycetota bacterium]
MTRSLVCLGALASAAAAQSYSTATWEMTLDDETPYGAAGAPLELEHYFALVVRAVDVDDNGWKDIVIGGLGTSGYHVRIHYLDWINDAWSITHVETLQTSATYACYDLEIGDLDAAGGIDIVVGRRLGSCEPKNGARDSVFLRNSSADSSGNWYGSASAVPNPNCLTSCSSAPCGSVLGETFSVSLNDVDGDSDLDLLSAGNYGIRYFRNNGSGAFTHAHTYYDQGDMGLYRDLALGDVDGDGDDDLVASRMGNLHTRVWISQRNDSGFDANDPFEPQLDLSSSPQPIDLGFTSVAEIEWQLVGTCSQNGQTGSVPGEAVAFASELTDLDGDDDLDLVIAYNQSPCAAFLNNGDGYFGSIDDAQVDADNDAAVAFEFPPMTATFVGQSDMLDCALAGTGCSLSSCAGTPPTPVVSAPPSGCDYVWTLPGVRINYCTDVAIADCNGDELPDVTFSNRNDFHDAFSCFNEHGLLTGTHASYDYLFFNESTPGNLAFSQCVERIGLPNDGTGYGEFVDLNPPKHYGVNDRRPDWLDANFSNVAPGENGKNRMWWGLRLAAVGCEQVDTPNSQTPQIPVRLHYTTSAADNTKPWLVLGSYSGMTPWSWGGVTVPITYDSLIQAMYDLWVAQATFSLSYSGSSLDSDGVAISFDFPTSISNALASYNDLYFALFQFNWDSTVTPSNPLRLPLVLP